MESGEEIIDNLLSGKLRLNTFRTWISNFEVSTQEEGLFQKNGEPITQKEFIILFLNFLRDRARHVKSQAKKNVENKPRTFIAHNQQKTPPGFMANQQYSEEFPTLEMSASSKQGTKSMRRINPTPIRKEIEEGKKRFLHKNKQEMKKKDISLVTSVEKDKFNSRFSSSLSLRPSSKKNVSCVPFDKKCVELTVHFERQINVIADVYTCLLTNNLVPSLSNEIQFILNVFNHISNIDNQIFPINKSNNDTTLLYHIVHWQYFCIEIFIRLQSTIFKMDYIIRSFLHNRISNLNFHSTRNTLFLEKLKKPFHKNKLTFIIPVEKLCEDTSGMKPNCFNSKKDVFFELEKDWKLNCSETDLVAKLDFLLTFNITSLNTFGKIFVESLIKSLEDSRKDDIYGNKFNKLTQRMSTPPEQEDYGFFHFELFYKSVIDFCFVQCPQNLLYIKFWLLNFLKSLSKEYFGIRGKVPASDDLRNRIVSGLFIKISLAKFLGYIEFWNIKKCEDLSETEKHIQTVIQGEIGPPLDLNEIFFWAVKEGQLFDTIPWMVQFISMASKSTTFLPYYKQILILLMSIGSSSQISLSDEDNSGVLKIFLCTEVFNASSLVKLNILKPKARCLNTPETQKFYHGIILVKKSTLLFIKLWIGKLFNNKIFGEDIYFKLFLEYTKIVKEMKSNLDSFPVKRTTDSVFEVDEDIFLMLCSHFSKMTYWDQNQFTSSSKMVRNIRPLQLESDDEQTPTDGIDIQAMLEEQFIKDNQSLSLTIEFISSRVYDVFLNEMVSQNFSKEKHCGILKRVIDDCHLRIRQSIIALTPKDTDELTRDVTISICFKRFKNEIKKWLILHGYEELLQPVFNLGTLSLPNSIHIQKGTFDDPKVVNELFINSSHHDEVKPSVTYNGNLSNYSPKVTTALINLSYKMRELNRNENVVQNIIATIDEFIMLSKKMIVKNDILKSSKENPFLNDLHIMSWDYVLEILTNQPQLITKEFLEKMILFWKKYFHLSNNAERLFCPRLIKASVLKKKPDQKLIAYNIAQIAFWVFKHELATIEELEVAYYGILQHTWNEDELNFLLMTLSKINNLIKKDGQFALLPTIDIVSDSIIGIMETESMQRIFHE